MLLLLICVSIAAFFLVSLSPVDPLQANVGQTALGSMSQEQIAKLNAYWGVGQPPVERFLAWASDFFRGDMGISLLYRRPVAEVIAVKFANSIWLLAIAWVISGVMGFCLGALAGMKQGTWVDKIIKGYSLVIASTPAFWLALVRTHWHGGRRSDPGRPDPPCHPSGADPQHYGCFQYNPPHQGKND